MRGSCLKKVPLKKKLCRFSDIDCINSDFSKILLSISMVQNIDNGLNSEPFYAHTSFLLNTAVLKRIDKHEQSKVMAPLEKVTISFDCIEILQFDLYHLIHKLILHPLRCISMFIMGGGLCFRHFCEKILLKKSDRI